MDVTLKVGTTIMGTITLNIAPGTIAKATWDVSSFAKGQYTLTVSHPGPAGKPMWADTYTVSGTINTLEGDVNGDFKVDMADMVLFSTNWLKPLNDFPNEDLNNDGVKSVIDIPYILNNYGYSDP